MIEMRIKRKHLRTYLLSSLLTFPVCSIANNVTVPPSPPVPVVLQGGTTPDTLTVNAGGVVSGGAGAAVSIQNPPVGQASNNTITVAGPTQSPAAAAGIIQSQPAAAHGVIDTVDATGGQSGFTLGLDGTLQALAGGGSSNAIYSLTTHATSPTIINIGANSPSATLTGDVFLSIGNGQNATINFNQGSITTATAAGIQLNGFFNFTGPGTFTGNLSENGTAGQTLAVRIAGTPVITGQLGTAAHPITNGLTVGPPSLTGTYNLTLNSSANLTGTGITVSAPVGALHNSINMSGTSSISTPSLSNSDIVNVGAGTTFTVTGAGQIFNFNTAVFTVSGTGTVSVQTINNTGTFTLSPNSIIQNITTINNGAVGNTNGIFNLGAIINNFNGNNLSNLATGAGQGFFITNGGALTIATNGFTNNGNFTINGGTLTISTIGLTNNSNFTVSSGTFTATSLTNTQTVNNGGTFNIPTVNNTGGTYTITNGGSLTTGVGGVVTNAAGATFTGNNGSTLNTPTFNNGGTVSDGGNFTINTLTNSNGGTSGSFTITSGGSLTSNTMITNPLGATFTGNNGGTLNAVAFTNAGTVSDGGAFTINTLTNNNAFTLTNGGSLTSNTLITNAAGATFTGNAGSTLNAITFNNGGTVSDGGTFTINTLTNSNAATFSLLNGGILTSNTMITNAAGATLTSNSGSTLNAATLTNLGTINGAAGASGAFNITTLNNNSPGTFALNSGGSLTATNFNNNAVAGFTSQAGSSMNIGTLSNSSINFTTASDMTVTTLNNNGGAILNNQAAGTIDANTIQNAGTFSNSGTVVANTIQNTGTFTMQAGSAADVGTIVNSNMFNVNSGSTIAANTFLDNGTLNIFGGVINSPITSSTNTGIINVIGTFSTSAPISGVTTILVPGTLNINNPISGYSTFLVSGTANLNPGGSFGNIQGGGPGSVLNINTNYTTTGTLGAPGFPFGTINLVNGVTLTLQNPIYTTSNTFINNGNILLTNSQVLTGSYIQTASGSITTVIQSGTPTYGQLVVNGPATVGGTIIVDPTNLGIGIANQQTFDIITSFGLTDNGPAVISQTNNPFLTFVRDFDPGTPPNNVRIKAVYSTPEAVAAGNPSLVGVSSAILSLFESGTSNAGLNELLLTLASAGPNLSSDLTQLLPLVNGMEIIPSLYQFYPLFDQIAKHFETRRYECGNFGYSAGDMTDLHPTVGPIFYGNVMQQQAIQNLDGYNAQTGGMAVMADFPIGCWMKLGVGLSYAATGAKTFFTGDSVFINSSQGFVYGCLEYWNYVFFDFMAAIAQNNYRTTRNIAFLDEAAQASFTGVQGWGKMRVGFNILLNNLMITPLGTYQLTRLNQREYNEKNGGAANLTVIGNHVTAGEVAVGLKLSEVSEPERFVPEIHAFYLKYLKEPSFNITSQFIAGGPLFITQGPTFPKSGGMIGGSITVRLSDRTVFMGTYDYEGRKNFTAHIISLKFKMMF